MRIIDWNIGYKCNLDCGYCYLGRNKYTLSNMKFKFTDHMDELLRLRSEDELQINIIGGEPFLLKDFIDEVTTLMSNSIKVCIITNMVTGNIEKFMDICKEKDILDLLTIVGSLHYFENARNNLEERWLKHYHLYKNNNVNITIQVVAHPKMKNHIGNLLDSYPDVDFYFLHYNGKYRKCYYPDDYTPEEHQLFQIESSWYDQTRLGQKCSAGRKTLSIDEYGNYAGCVFVLTHAKLDNSLMEFVSNISNGFNFSDEDMVCPYKYHCQCPPEVLFDEGIYNAKNFDRETFRRRQSS